MQLIKTKVPARQLAIQTLQSAHTYRWVWVCFGIVILIWSVIVGSLLYLHLTQKAVITPIDGGAVVAVATPNPTPTPEPGRTIVLMGKGGVGHEGGGLTDTILVVRILEAQRRVVFISIPRDLWVHLPSEKVKNGKGKINSAYPLGGGALAKEVVSSVLGIPIDSYITIDFSGFERAIDILGGIDVYVDRAFTDYEYPIAGRENLDCSQPVVGAIEVSEADLLTSGALVSDQLPDLPKQYPCRYELLHFDAGLQHMDGKTALKYVRSRHSSEDGNDFSRSRRQKLVLDAVAGKLLSAGAATKVPGFFSTLRSHVDTDLSMSDIVRELPQAATIRSYPVTTIALSTDNYLGQGYTADRQFALTPLVGEENYVAIHNWVASILSPQVALEYPTIEINTNWKSASISAVVQKTLVDAGYPASLGRVVTKNATTTATLMIGNPVVSTKTIEKLQQLLAIPNQYVGIASSSTKQSTRDIQLLLP